MSNKNKLQKGLKRTRELFYFIKETPLRYYKSFSIICNSTTAGILLSQLIYWAFEHKGEFYNTDEELACQTGMTLNEVRAAKRKLKVLNFVNYQRKGVPAKTFYIINLETIKDVLLELDDKNVQTRLSKNYKLDYKKVTNKNDIKLQTNTNISSNISSSSLSKDKEEQGSKKEYGNAKINKFYSKFKEMYGYSLIEERKYANSLVNLLTKRGRRGQVKEGREWLSENFEENLDKFLNDLEIYFGKTIPRRTFPIMKACQFYIANKGFDVLKQGQSGSGGHSSYPKSQPRVSTGDFSTPKDILSS